MRYVNPAVRKMELRFSARDLINKDVFSLSDPFLVCHTVRHGLPNRQIGRTETVQDDLNPTWATTFSFDYDPAVHATSTLVLDIFDRDSRDSDTLSKHDFLGRAFFRLCDLVDSAHMRLDIPLQPARSSALFPACAAPSSTSSSLTSQGTADDDAPYAHPCPDARLSPQGSRYSSDASGGTANYVRESEASVQLKRATSGSRAGKVRGSVTVVAEELAASSGISVRLHVRSALLRDACALGAAFGAARKVAQFYEVQRERREGTRTTWGCVYRSRDGVTVDRNNYVVFDDVCVEERVLTNMDADRALRLAFYRRHTRSPHELISYVTLTLADICTARFRNNDVALRMEGEFGDDDGLGNVLVQRVERWVAEPDVERLTEDGGVCARDDVHVHFRADHFLHRKYISSLNDNPRHMRRLRRKPAFITLH